MAITTSISVAILLILFIYACAPFVTSVFNSEHDAQLAAYAQTGLRLYFTGFLFAGMNAHLVKPFNMDVLTEAI